MKTDRELLELAAKAAGIAGKWDTYKQKFRVYIGLQQMFLGDEWNPLEDDGDALRLAVKLNLSVQSYPSWNATLAWHPGSPASAPEEPHGTDPCASTRRVIVRAAAAIGEEI